MTKPELKRLLRWWQKKLRLQDWDITIEFCAPKDIENDLGHCHRELQSKTAHVRIQREPECHANSRHERWNSDIETTLVHELLHIVTARLCKDLDEQYKDDEEYIMNLMSEVLVGLKREL